MKRMKRAGCFLISFVMFLSVLVIVPSAQDHVTATPSTTINNYLVTHWDFEGTTEAEQLSDKAPSASISKGNKNADTLAAYRSSADALVIKNGEATIKPDANTYLWLSNADFPSFDGRVVEKSTIYANFSFSGENTGFAHILSIPGIFRIFRHTNGQIRMQMLYETVGTNQWVIDPDFVIHEGDDVHFAVVFNDCPLEATEAGAWTLTVYLSTDGKNYISSNIEVPVSRWQDGNGRNTAAKEGKGLYIGNYMDSSGNMLPYYSFDLTVKDVRFYNKVMEKTEVAQIASLDASAPVVVGCQNTEVDEAGLYSIRFVASIPKLEYSEAGFSIALNYTENGLPVEKSLNKKCRTAYEALTANAAGDIQKITASDMGGAYLLALTIDEIPQSIGKIDFTVRAYGVDAQGQHWSQPASFQYDGGEFLSKFVSLANSLGAVAAWNFDDADEGDLAVTDLVSGRTGSLVGCEIADSFYGKGIRTYSDRKSYLDLGVGTLGKLMNGKSAISLSMWVMPYLNSNADYRLFTLQIDDSTQIAVSYRNAWVTVEARSSAEDSATKKMFFYNIDDGTVPSLSSYTNEARWQHLTVVLDFANNRIHLYVNGELSETLEQPGFSNSSFVASTPQNNHDAFGGATTDPTHSFNGLMDSMMLFDRALTAAEVAELALERNTADSPAQDQATVEAIVAMLRQNLVVYEHGNELIYNGLFDTLLHEDYSAKTVTQNGVPYIPKDTARRYFYTILGATEITVDGIAYLDLAALCNANSKTLLSYNGLFMVMNSNAIFDASAHRLILERIIRLFEEHYSPTIEGAKSRTVVSESGKTYTYNSLTATVGYCTCPSVVTVGDSIFVSMDTSGGKLFVFESTDGGATFTFRSMLNKFHFATIFELDGNLYLMGSYIDDAGTDLIGIARSTDGARTWSGISRFAGADSYDAHSSSNSILIANGRIYKAYNGRGGDEFTEGCTAYMVSAPITAELLRKSSWTISNSVEITTSMITSHPYGTTNATRAYIEEGNAVQGRNGEILGIYSLKAVPSYGYAAVLNCSADGTTLTFDQSSDSSIVKLPGGNAKFTVRYDEATDKYITLVTGTADNRSWFQRNVLALAVSDDLVNWEVKGDVLTDPTVMNTYVSIAKHGFQYADFVFDGEDLLFVVREAMGDSECFHNANYTTFYRLKNYSQYLQ